MSLVRAGQPDGNRRGTGSEGAAGAAETTNAADAVAAAADSRTCRSPAVSSPVAGPARVVEACRKHWEALYLGLLVLGQRHLSLGAPVWPGTHPHAGCRRGSWCSIQLQPAGLCCAGNRMRRAAPKNAAQQAGEL